MSHSIVKQQNGSEFSGFIFPALEAFGHEPQLPRDDTVWAAQVPMTKPVSLATGNEGRNMGGLRVRANGRELGREPSIVGMNSHKSQPRRMDKTDSMMLHFKKLSLALSHYFQKVRWTLQFKYH